MKPARRRHWSVWAAIVLLICVGPFIAIAAALALFRFKIGVIQTLLACSLAGVVLHLAFGAAL